MIESEKQLYQLGRFQLDAAERLLILDTRPVAIEPKAFDILLLLVKQNGHLVGKDELMRAVWPNTFVEESNLTRNISLLRKLLAEGFAEPCIETVPKHGYRFLPEVNPLGRPEVTELIAERHTITRLATEEEEDGEHQTARSRDSETSRQATAQSQANVARQFTEPRARRRVQTRVAVAVVCVLLIAGAAFGLRQLFRTRTSGDKTRQAFQAMQVGRFTASGNIVTAAISPDGKYVATVLDEDGLQSLWVRQVASNTSSIRLVGPGLVEYWGLTFSNDSNFIYYVSWVRNESGGWVYELPVFGGTPRKLPTSIDTPISFSPDGARFTYVLSLSSKGESYVKIADVDGGGDQTLIQRRLPDFVATYPGGPAWSPDGRVIAYAAGATGQDADHRMRVFMADVAGKSERPLTSQSWRGIGRVVWLSDGSGLVISAMEEMDAPRQLWFVSYPDDAARRITNDLHDYDSISLTSDAKTIAAVQTEGTFSISVAPRNDDDPARSDSSAHEIFSEVGSGREGLTWTPDNRVVYSSRAGGNYDVWSAKIDGSDKRQLTFDPHNDLFPSVSADGRYLFFASDRAGTFNIWRTDIDGSNPVQLTRGRNQTLPAVSPDGQWVFYQQGITNDEPNVWRVPAAGGEPERVTEALTYRPALSPDGRLLAYVYLDQKEWGIGVRSLDGGAASDRKFPFPSSVGSRVFRWTPDGQALAYIANEKGVSNIWLQPVSGGPARQLTNFKTGQLSSFAWSTNSQWSAYLRHTATSDVVLLSNFK